MWVIKCILNWVDQVNSNLQDVQVSHVFQEWFSCGSQDAWTYWSSFHRQYSGRACRSCGWSSAFLTGANKWTQECRHHIYSQGREGHRFLPAFFSQSRGEKRQEIVSKYCLVKIQRFLGWWPTPTGAIKTY